jgi:hypothetical protein
MWRWGGVVLAAMWLSVIAAPRAQAEAIYTYTGNPFTSIDFSEEGIPGLTNPLSYSDFVSGEFTVGSPLPDNFNGSVLPNQVSFSNGVFTLDASLLSLLAIQTSDTGAIIAWDIVLDLTGVPVEDNISTSNSGDSTSFNFATTAGESFDGSNSGNPGKWSVAITPLPSSLPLFACGLFLLPLLRRRLQRGAHPAD